MLYVPFNGKAIVPVNNANWSELNDPKINAAMDKAAAVTDPKAARKAWARRRQDDHVERAPAIPEIWDNQRRAQGTKTSTASATSGTTDWDLAFSSVELATETAG